MHHINNGYNIIGKTRRKNMEPENQTPQPTTSPVTYVQVDVRFLQMILDYLKTRPYGEVFQMVDILTGKAQLAPPQAPPPANIKEYKPE